MYKQGLLVSRKLRHLQGDIQHFSAGIQNFFCQKASGSKMAELATSILVEAVAPWLI